ncbi:MAG: TOBE domain-containing protein, partial [Nitrospirales bacterium]|nr:TOBE domain-containing protein [Nitrospirales bacterium]
LEFLGGHLQVPHLDGKIGDHVRVHLLAKDISIIKTPPSVETSVLNVLRATVKEIGPTDHSVPFVDIKLDIGCPLIATITRKSLKTLHLQPGDRVWAQIKAVSFSHSSGF